MVFSRYERDISWYVAGTDEDKRKICGPRLARDLTGRAKQIIEGMGPAEILKVSDDDGPTFLLKYIKEMIGDPVVTEVAQEMEAFLFKFPQTEKARPWEPTLRASTAPARS